MGNVLEKLSEAQIKLVRRSLVALLIARLAMMVYTLVTFFAVARASFLGVTVFASAMLALPVVLPLLALLLPSRIGRLWTLLLFFELLSAASSLVTHYSKYGVISTVITLAACVLLVVCLKSPTTHPPSC